MIIKILGSGCKNCQRLYQNTLDAVALLKLDAEVIKVTDFMEIAKFQVMRMPVLVIDESVIISGRVPEKEEIVKAIEKRV